MKISTRTRYGLRIMIFLALQKPEKPISVKIIADNEGITVKYTEQIIRLLKNAAFLNVSRGAKGGYSLKTTAYNTTVYEIFTLLERDQSLLKCLALDLPKCPQQQKCSTYEAWKGLEEVITNYLSNLTIENLANKHAGKLDEIICCK